MLTCALDGSEAAFVCARRYLEQVCRDLAHMGAELLTGTIAQRACEVGCGLGVGLRGLLGCCSVKKLYAVD